MPDSRDSVSTAVMPAPTSVADPAGAPPPLVGVVMGSTSDWPTMRLVGVALDGLGVPWEARVVSAHRTPELLVSYARGAVGRGLRVVVAGAGGAAHLPGMIAALTPLPVIGVPVRSSALAGVDSLLSIVSMPAGVPVATVAIGPAGATNAGLLAGRILGVADPAVRAAVQRHADAQRDAVLAAPDPRDLAAADPAGGAA